MLSCITIKTYLHSQNVFSLIVHMKTMEFDGFSVKKNEKEIVPLKWTLLKAKTFALGLDNICRFSSNTISDKWVGSFGPEVSGRIKASE